MDRTTPRLGITGQSWMSDKLEVRASRRHNQGVFARAPIQAGERVAIFGGDVMWIDEINDLSQELRRYPMQIEERFVLGSRGGGQPERTDYFNHCCEPNCGFKGQMFLVAMRDIRKGEELSFDYAMVVSPSVGSDIVFKMKCQCGAKSCRKTITEQDWQIPDLQRRYAGYFSQYLEDKIAWQKAAAAANPATLGSAVVPRRGPRSQVGRQVAIVMHDEAQSEIHHFVRQAGLAQEAVRLLHVLAPPKTIKTLALQRIEAATACEAVFRLRSRSGLQDSDVIVGVTPGNLCDAHDDEFFMVNGRDHPRRGKPFPRTALISLYYLNEKSTFMKDDGRGAWRSLNEVERQQKRSDSILLLLLTALASELCGVACHETAVGCIMDFCQTPSELLEALRSGFIFCDTCRSQLEPTDEGRAALSIATRLTHYRLAPAEQRTAFLSYAHKDEKAVLAVDQWLRDHNILTRLDRYDFKYGERIRKEIDRAMRESSSIVIFYSKNSRDRSYTKLERDFADDMQFEGKSRIIYFCLDGTQLPDEHAAAHLAIMAKGKSFNEACTELQSGILALCRPAERVDLSQYDHRAPWA